MLDRLLMFMLSFHRALVEDTTFQYQFRVKEVILYGYRLQGASAWAEILLSRIRSQPSATFAHGDHMSFFNS